MAKKEKEVSESKSRAIVLEIRDKVEDYENNMSSFMSRVGEWGDLFQVRQPQRRNKKTFSNPRLTEFFRAVNTLGTMMYRMQTAQDPFFDLVPMSLIRYPGQLMRIQGAIETQLDESEFKRNLLKADMGVAAFGTQIVEETYEIKGVSPFGRRVPVTTFKPRSLLQVAFERGTTDISFADWLSTADLASDSALLKLAEDSDELGQQWQKSVIEDAVKDKSADGISQFILQRLSRQNFINTQGQVLRKELLVYYGKLDCMNDNVEYVCALVNRKYLVKFHPNRNQHGKRDFRVGYWVEDPLTLDPLGMGIGAIAGNLHKSMDANRQRAQDGIAMAAYNMWGRLREAGIADDDLKIRPLQTIPMDVKGGLFPLLTDLNGPTAALKLEDILRNEFMAASGATPTLQAQLTDATASEVSLAQNEAVRNISVKAEIIAEQFMREHLRVVHYNNVQFVDKPFNINKSGFAGLVYPKDLEADVDFRVKITTDKDYKPQRLEKLIQLVQILTSTKSMHPDQFQLSIVPLVKEIARGLGVSPDEVIQPMDPQMMQMMMSARGGSPGTPIPDAGSAPALGTVSTPVGQVLGSPA